jgi:MFS family permease
MSDDMLYLAIPSVARDLHATAAGVQWILNAYYIPLVAFVLVAGSVGDIIGHRRVFTARAVAVLHRRRVVCHGLPPSAPLLSGSSPSSGAHPTHSCRSRSSAPDSSSAPTSSGCLAA